MAVVTVTPPTSVGAVAAQDHDTGQFAVDVAAQLPSVSTEAVVVGTSIDQVMLMFGAEGTDAQFVRETRNVATHAFACVGALSKLTVTPDCGLLTVKLNPVIDVTPPGMLLAIDTVVSTFAVPLHTRSRLAYVQFDGAPGYSGAYAAAWAAVTVIPSCSDGAVRVHDHCAGQFEDPPDEQSPDSHTHVETVLELAVQVIRICGLTGV
jgi:hypothetical protein